MPPIVKKDKPVEAKAAAGVKGIRERGVRQTPEVLGFTAVKVVPGFKGKARMKKRPFGGAR